MTLQKLPRCEPAYYSPFVLSHERMAWTSSVLRSSGSQWPAGRFVTERSRQVRRMGSPRRLRVMLQIPSNSPLTNSTGCRRRTAEGQGFVVLPEAASRFSGPQGREADVTELLATHEQTGGVLGLVRQTIAPNSGPPLHIHRANDEFFYIVSGEFRIVSAPAQSIVFVPRGTAHTFENVGTKPGVLLVGVTPGGLEMMFAERQGVDPEANQTLMKKHNMEVVGPPLHSSRPGSGSGANY
jgi:mannose-6-phosphate isomerase-like protein (cupin superfamily)